MGLHHGDQKQPAGHYFAAWPILLGATLVAVSIGALGETGRDWLAFDRTHIGAGEYWRLVSGHFAHLGTKHLILNLAGMWLVGYLVGSDLRSAEWVFAWVSAIFGVSVGLWFLQPGLEWYVGLSGLLHGLLAAGIVASIGRWSIEYWIIAAALVAKLAFEQLSGPLPGSESTAGGTVIVSAHLYGGVSGLFAGAAILIRVRQRASI